MTDAPTPPAAAPASATAAPARPAARSRFKLPKGLAPSKIEALTFAVAALALSNAYLFAEQRRDESPMIVTVGVRQLTADYMLNVAHARMQPEELKARTDLFLAVAQDSMKRMATEKGVVVIAREAVLGGEYADVTSEVAAAVRTAMDSAGAAAPAALIPPPAVPLGQPSGLTSAPFAAAPAPIPGG